jgi:serine/threonine protein kinase
MSENHEKKEREYEFYKKVQHKNIVNYLNNFIENGKRYLVLEYFPFTLESMLKKRKLD